VDQASHLRKMMKNENQRVLNSGGKSPQTAGEDGPRVFSITSGKGGVGKTNIVANLALAFTRLGKKVLIFDADLGLANIDIVFGIHPKYNIGHVVSGEKELHDVIAETPSGIGIIPAMSGEENMSELTESQKLILLSEFETIENIYDVVLVDTAAGISGNVIYFNLAAEECIVVVTGEPTSITDAYGIIKVLYGHGAKRFKLLINMVSGEDEAKSVYFTLCQATARFLKGVVTEYMGFVPADKHLRDSVIAQTPLLEKYPGSPAAKAISSLAGKLLSTSRRTDLDGNIKFFMQRLLNVT
jgi:flagellar biosynthesis protein FlhG